MSTAQRRNLFTVVGVVIAAITLIALIFGGGNPNLQGTAAQLPTATASTDTVEPTILPTDGSETVAEQPTEAPVDLPTDVPTDTPSTEIPTEIPTNTPTDVPTEIPTNTPTDVPTDTPTLEPQVISTIEVNNPPPDKGIAPRILPAACQMNITDAGDTDPFTFVFEATGREIAGYSWDLGDPAGTPNNTPAGAGPHNFTYSATGTFNIALTCNTTTGGTLNPTGQVNIQNIVTALFEVTPGLAGIKPYDIALVNLSSGANLTYLWEVTEPISGFSDTSTQAEPEFTLPNAGTYTITLTVDDGAGTVQTAMATVIVYEPAPKANIDVDTVAGEVPLTVNIIGVDELEGPITTWTWTFTGGSPASATGQGPHTVLYSTAGTYTVRLDYSGPGGGGFAEKQIGVFEGGADVTAAFDYYFTGRDVGAGNAEVCFNNLSTGPVDVAQWDFSYDGSTFNTEYSGLDSPVCYTYTGVGAGLNFTVRLHVENGAGTRTSNAQTTILVVGAPMASFNFGPNPVTWNSSVNFTDTSTGSITLWEWDFGNGQTFTTTTGANPPAILYNQGLGNHVIRLKVTGPGGSSTSEAILLVERLDIGCSITGNFNPLPNTAQTYTANLTNVFGRDVTYKWSIVGPGVSASGTNSTINQTFVNSGAYLITMTGTTDDGSECTATKTVQVQYTDPTCSISGNFSPYPDGTTYNYTLTVNDPLTPDRTPVMVEWFINGVSQGASTAGAFTFSRSWSLPVVETLKVEAIVTNPDGTKTGCDAQQTIDVKYPPLSCDIAFITGGTVVPTMPDTARTYVYRSQITPASLAGRTVVGHSWTWTAGVSGVVSTNTYPDDTLTLEWLWNQTGAHTASVIVTVQDPLGNTYTCNPTENITVTVPPLTCGNVIGDLTPIIGDNVTYTRNVTNLFGRTIYESGFKLELEDLPLNSGIYGTPLIDKNFPPEAADFDNISYTFNDPGRKYRISYYVKVLNPDGTNGPTCSKAYNYITTPDSGTALFDCEGWATTNNYTLNPLTTNRTYKVNIDNTYTTPGLPLAFDWVIKDYLGNTVASGTKTANTDGSITLFTNNANGLGFTFTDSQYTFDVSVRDTSGTTTYTCIYPTQKLTVGALTVDYTIPGSTAWDIADEICLTNTSKTAHDPTGDALTYVWDLGTPNNSLGTQTYTGKTPPCFTYNAQGNYVVKVTGTTASGLMSASKQYTFKVYNSQKIAINYSGVDFPFVGSMTFDAILTNVTFVNWEFTRPDGTTFTRTGDPHTELLNVPGEWTVKATGTGPLGNISATVKFTLIDTDAIAASFIPSVYGGLAPLNVCFTDTSKGDNINKWEWDFDGDGTIDLTYTTPPTGPICYTYTVGSTEYPVKLFIENATGKKANATNYITTYNVVEAGATFNISNEGGGKYCFTPVVDPGINVTGWEFGDGAISPATGYVCHTYSYSGTFVVTMLVESGGTPGKVKRPVVVTFGPKPVPTLNASASCAANGKASFTITNTGDNMPTTDRVTIKNSGGAVVYLDETLKLNGGESRVYTLSGVYDTLTLTLLDNSSVTANTTCYEPPNLSVGGACQADGSAVFTVTNSSKDTDANQSYTVKDGGGTTVDSGTVTAVKNGGTQTITVSGVYGPLTFSTDNSAIQGPTTAATANTNCDQPPVISVSGACEIDGTALFTVTNSSTATDADQPYTVKNSGGTVVASGTISAAKNGGTQEVRVANIYGYLLFETASTTGQGSTTVANANTDCAVPPTLTGSGTCSLSGEATFVIKNSGEVDASQPYTITDSGGVIVDSGTLDVPAKKSTSISVSDLKGTVTFKTSGAQGETTKLTISTTCDPLTGGIGVSSSCTSSSVVFSITNGSSDPLTQPYTVTDGNNTVVDSGTLAIAENDTVEISVAKTDFPPMTFISEGGITLSNTSTCEGKLGGNNNGSTPPTTNNGGTGGSNKRFFSIDRTPGTPDTTPVERPAWESLGAMGGDICVDWLLYHTDQTTDWEIFRLGEEPRYPNADPNLSNSKDSTDIMPSRSPDKEWIVFSSDRDGNWEVYVTRVDNTITRRLTYNTAAKDLDAVWSPDGRYISYETDRDGNWEIYVFDLVTGEERRLTDVPGNDINGFWTHDSKHVVFQSDRDGLWQIYTVNVETGEVTRISDGQADDIDPAVSFKDDRIAFRSTRDGSTVTRIYVMNMDGSDVQAISPEGATASSQTWYVDDSIIAYQSDADGDFDIYVYEFASQKTRLVTDNTIGDYAPTWFCSAPIVIFTSDIIDNDPNIYNTPALPIEANAILVEEEASQMTENPTNDIYPENSPSEENASLEDSLPPKFTAP